MVWKFISYLLLILLIYFFLPQNQIHDRWQATSLEFGYGHAVRMADTRRLSEAS